MILNQPNDILYCLYDYLMLLDFFNLNCVCKRFNDVTYTIKNRGLLIKRVKTALLKLGFDQDFFKKLYKSKAVISGKFITQCLTDVVDKDSLKSEINIFYMRFEVATWFNTRGSKKNLYEQLINHIIKLRLHDGCERDKWMCTSIIDCPLEKVFQGCHNIRAKLRMSGNFYNTAFKYIDCDGNYYKDFETMIAKYQYDLFKNFFDGSRLVLYKPYEYQKLYDVGKMDEPEQFDYNGNTTY